MKQILFCRNGFNKPLCTITEVKCYCSILFYLLRLNSIVPCFNLCIDLHISYLFRILLNKANNCSHASGDMGLIIIYIFWGFCLNTRFLNIIAQIFG
jgi:hypothetical protein